MLVTRRLALRRFTAADAGHLLALDGDPAVMRFLEPGTKSRAEVENEVLPRFLAYNARYQDFGFWAADIRADGRFAGWFGLRPVTPSADAMAREPPPGRLTWGLRPTLPNPACQPGQSAVPLFSRLVGLAQVPSPIARGGDRPLVALR